MKPCPFCGHPPDETVVHTEDFYAFVTCRNCGANGPSVAVFESSREQATVAWDRRAMTCDTQTQLDVAVYAFGLARKTFPTCVQAPPEVVSPPRS